MNKLLSKTLNTQDNKSLLSLFLLLFCLLTLLACLLVYFNFRAQSADLLNLGQRQVSFLKRSVQVEIKSLVSDLMLLSSMPELMDFQDGSSPQKQNRLAEAGQALMMSKGFLAQVSILNSHGRELINLENEHGRAYVSTGGKGPGHPELHEFRKAWQLAPGEVYFSKFRWQFSKKAGPHAGRWLLDIATPLVDKGGLRWGVIWLVIAADEIIRPWHEEIAASGAELALMDNSGSAITRRGTQSSKDEPTGRGEWPLRIQANTETYKALMAAGKGHFQDSTGRFIYDTLQPVFEALKHSSGSGDAFLSSAAARIQGENLLWKIVLLQPAYVLRGLFWKELAIWASVWLGASLILAFICWNVIQGRIRRDAIHRVQRINKERFILKNAFEHSALGMAVLNPKGSFLEVNAFFNNWLGYTRQQLQEMTIQEVAHPEDRLLIDQELTLLFQDKKPFSWFEMRLTGQEGATFWARISLSLSKDDAAQPLYFIAHLQDISEMKRAETEKAMMEAELRQAQKLEAIGTLAGGVAHDFNNILGIMHVNAELALTATQDRPELVMTQTSERLDKIIQAVDRGRELVARILSFCDLRDSNPWPTDISAAVAETLNLLEASLPKNVSLNRDLPSRPLGVMATPGDIPQIVTNLCLNAAHALKSTGGYIKVSLHELDEALNPDQFGPVGYPGSTVKLVVADNGPGIDSDISDKIFEPFFTTKEPKEGTGLGLATVKRIVAGLGGSVQLNSQVDGGCEFTVRLPCFQGDIPDQTQTLLRNDQQGGSLLLVDDEPDLVEALQEALNQIGYTVEAFQRGEEALKHFTSHSQDFQLVISDQNMPGLSGTQLAQRIHELKPDVPIILCSGSYHIIDLDQEKKSGVRAILRKPFSVAELISAVQKVLLEETHQ